MGYFQDRSVGKDEKYEYFVKDGYLYRKLRSTTRKHKPIRLANFTAKVIAADDDSLAIRVDHLNGKASHIQVSRSQFNKGTWITIPTPSCIVDAGRMQSLKKAIRALSNVEF